MLTGSYRPIAAVCKSLILAESKQLQMPTGLAMPHEVFIDTLMCSLNSELFLSRHQVA